MLSYAKCCTPIPGDPIVGHLSAGKGMVVHLDTCKNISDIRHNPEKMHPIVLGQVMSAAEFQRRAARFSWYRGAALSPYWLAALTLMATLRKSAWMSATAALASRN